MALNESTLLPRVSDPMAIMELQRLHGHAVEELTPKQFDLGRATFHPHQDGKVPVPTEDLIAWRESLVAWAQDRGFPSELKTESDRFDWDVALGERLDLDLADVSEALHPAFWCFAATFLFPDFVVHRYGWPSGDAEALSRRSKWRRFLSDSTNGLRLTLYRHRAFGPKLSRAASQQELQSLLNRPSYGNDPRVAKVVLEALVEAASDPASRYGKDGGTRAIDADLVTTEVRIVNSLRPLCFMTDEAVHGVVTSAIEQLPELRARSTRKDMVA